MWTLLLLPQNGEVGLKYPWNRPLASSKRKRPNEWSGCRQLASGIISFVACRLIPQLPPPHQSWGAVGTAGAITGWGCARRKLGTGGMQGALPCRLQRGRGLPCAPSGWGHCFQMHGGHFATELYVAAPSPPAWRPSVCLLSCPATGRQRASPTPTPACPPWLEGFNISFLIQNHSFT